MKCPTCGKTVNKGQPVCAFCGAMTGGPAAIPSATQSGEFHPPSFEQKKPPRVGEPGPEAQDRPILETPEGAEEFPELAPDAPQESESPQPKPPAWVRYVSPLFFVVLFLVTQFWLRDSDRSSPPGSEQTAESGPTLRQGTFAAEIPDGRTAETRTVFSLRDDRQIVFVRLGAGFYVEDLVQNDPYLRATRITMVYQGEERTTHLMESRFSGYVRQSRGEWGELWTEQQPTPGR